jgi:hypothetical protein
MTVHIDLIGGGNITETHARAALGISRVEISAIHGINPEKIGRLCREHGGNADVVSALAIERPLPYVEQTCGGALIFTTEPPQKMGLLPIPKAMYVNLGIMAAAKSSLS